MIQLNHLNLVVTQVAPAVTFFENYFNFKCTGIKGENAIAILKGEDDFTLVLMTAPDNNAVYPKAFHLGFMFNTKEEVDTLHKKLKSSSIDIGAEPKKIRDSYGFYFHFDTLMIEVGHYTS